MMKPWPGVVVRLQTTTDLHKQRRNNRDRTSASDEEKSLDHVAHHSAVCIVVVDTGIYGYIGRLPGPQLHTDPATSAGIP